MFPPLEDLGGGGTLFYPYDTSGNINQNISGLLVPHITWGPGPYTQLLSRVLTILVKVSQLLFMLQPLSHMQKAQMQTLYNCVWLRPPKDTL